MPKLHIQSGVLQGKVFELVEERISLGRALDNVIHLEEATVSHHHAMLLQENGDYKLRDLNSTNGTRVNGLRITEVRLNSGDQIRFGTVEIRYESEIKKSGQPLPPPRTGVDVSQIGRGVTAAPSGFGSASPFGKKRLGMSVTQWVLAGLGIVTFILLVMLVRKLL